MTEVCLFSFCTFYAMLLPLCGDYEMIVEDFQKQGARVTMKKSNRLTSMIAVTVLIVSACAVKLFNETYDISNAQIYYVIALCSVAMLFLISYMRNIHSESLLIIASIGVTVRESSILGTSSTFYDIQQIKDIVIVEAVTMYNIVFQLVLLPNQTESTCLPQESSLLGSSNKPKEKLHPLFHRFNPRLDDLQTIYRHIQEKLIIPRERSR